MASSQSPRLLDRILSFKSALYPHDREEKGYPNGGSEAVAERPMTIMTMEPGAFIQAQDKLLIFRTLTGIDTVPAIVHAGHAVRTAANIGIYTRVVREERRSKKTFRTMSLGIHLCLALQIIIGAAITAIAAADGSNSSLTGLGAMSTIFAGALAYVKGSGYPETLGHAELQWKRIREYIEQRERELCLADCPLDVYDEVRIVEDMYQQVKDEVTSGLQDSHREERVEVRPRPEPRSANDLRPSNSGALPPQGTRPVSDTSESNTETDKS